jgi:hypothetical protein
VGVHLVDSTFGAPAPGTRCRTSHVLRVRRQSWQLPEQHVQLTDTRERAPGHRSVVVADLSGWALVLPRNSDTGASSQSTGRGSPRWSCSRACTRTRCRSIALPTLLLRSAHHALARLRIALVARHPHNRRALQVRCCAAAGPTHRRRPPGHAGRRRHRRRRPYRSACAAADIQFASNVEWPAKLNPAARAPKRGERPLTCPPREAGPICRHCTRWRPARQSLALGIGSREPTVVLHQRAICSLHARVTARWPARHRLDHVPARIPRSAALRRCCRPTTCRTS